MTEPLIAIVIVNYRTAESVIQCCASIEGLNYRNRQVIVVDNASPDGSGKYLRAQLQKAEVILGPENLGFAAGVNIGIRRAQVLGARYIWLLNPDMTVQAEALDALVRLAEERPDAALLGSKVLFGNEEDQERIWGFGGRLGSASETISMIGHEELDGPEWTGDREVDYVPGCSILVRASALPRLGPMPEEFFMYYEETSWCARAKQAGFKLLVTSDSVVRHHFERTKLQRPFTVYYFNRNERLFWYRRRSALGRARMLVRVAVKDLPRAARALVHASTAEREVFRAHILSCIDFLLGRFGRRWLP